MDDQEFKQEILKMAKDNAQPLSEEKMQKLQNNVYAHIDTLFQAEQDAIDSPIVANKPNLSRRKSSFERLKDILADVFSVKTIGMAGLTVATLVFVFQLSTTTSTTLPDVPDSLMSAGLEQHTDHLTASSRALVSGPLSERRKAFLTGVTAAAAEVSGNNNKESLNLLVANYHVMITGEKSGVPATDKQLLKDNIDQYNDSSSTDSWLTEGYLVEILHLAAKHALIDMETTIVKDALNFYRDQTRLSISDPGEDIPDNFIENHQKLIEIDVPGVNTPTKIQSIIDTTQQMIVIIR